MLMLIKLDGPSTFALICSLLLKDLSFIFIFMLIHVGASTRMSSPLKHSVLLQLLVYLCMHSYQNYLADLFRYFHAGDKVFSRW